MGNKQYHLKLIISLAIGHGYLRKYKWNTFWICWITGCSLQVDQKIFLKLKINVS